MHTKVKTWEIRQGNHIKDKNLITVYKITDVEILFTIIDHHIQDVETRNTNRTTKNRNIKRNIFQILFE